MCIRDRFQTHAVDTTGAGDSFWGGVLCSILSVNKNVEKMEWEEIRKCAVLGNAVAGLCVQKRGGIPAIPMKEAVLELSLIHIYNSPLYIITLYFEIVSIFNACTYCLFMYII